jgi:hypothetical protein
MTKIAESPGPFGNCWNAIHRPFGEYSGSAANVSTENAVSSRSPEPSGLILQMLVQHCPNEACPNTSCLPFGDHDGSPLNPRKSVTCWTSLPSDFMVKISTAPVRSESKAIRLPSGDQSEITLFAPAAAVSCVTSLPSGFIV